MSHFRCGEAARNFAPRELSALATFTLTRFGRITGVDSAWPCWWDWPLNLCHTRNIRLENRHIRVARLLNPLNQVHPEQLPTLFDPVLLAMSPQAFTLTGFERIEGVDYARSWLVPAT